MKKVFLILALFLGLLTQAQTDTVQAQTLLYYSKPYKVAYYIPMLTWLDFTSPSINFGVEQSIKPRFGMYYEVGYINNNINPLYNQIYNRTFNGFKAKLEPRFYFNRTIKNNLFVAPNLYYKFNSVDVRDEEWARYGGQYFQLFSYQKQIHTLALTPSFGLVHINSGRKVGVAFSCGIGIRVQHIGRNIDFPEDAEINNWRDWFPALAQKPFGTYIRPNMFVNLAIVILGKKGAEQYVHFKETN